MWQGKVRGILQVEREPDVGHGIAKGFRIHTLRDPVDKRLEDAMHGLNPTDAASCSVLSTGAHQFIRLSKAMERLSHRNRREVLTRPEKLTRDAPFGSAPIVTHRRSSRHQRSQYSKSRSAPALEMEGDLRGADFLSAPAYRGRLCGPTPMNRSGNKVES